jgi:hypothetical protein
MVLGAAVADSAALHFAKSAKECCEQAAVCNSETPQQYTTQMKTCCLPVARPAPALLLSN